MSVLSVAGPPQYWPGGLHELPSSPQLAATRDRTDSRSKNYITNTTSNKFNVRKNL